ncbi:hypothetical protein DOM22_09015 [Bdellovibrio sp. ZAP7]|uniref:hypothetical protein n=1 Tax=Bdellovibrio sp. ZAP7 TaxID=2231053 RepID=UPI00115C40BA|nr:hypothetical protein [Bdellovibrio sp. ZAP7]QDK45282.1 hypothetical protein DOM22_09015 [Bdellovibrio sp. ZAP7]
MFYKTLLTIALATSPLLVQAHGEDSPGPNGGHIKMPGPFHTELEIDPVQGAHIFLLDMEFKNPTVQNSSVTAVFQGKGRAKVIAYKCGIMGGNHFHCVPQGKISGQGQLKIKAVRENAVGHEVVYDLPLKKFTETTGVPAVDHSRH